MLSAVPVTPLGSSKHAAGRKDGLIERGGREKNASEDLQRRYTTALRHRDLRAVLHLQVDFEIRVLCLVNFKLQIYRVHLCSPNWHNQHTNNRQT